MSSGRLQQQFIRLWQCCDGKTQDTTLNELAAQKNQLSAIMDGMEEGLVVLDAQRQSFAQYSSASHPLMVGDQVWSVTQPAFTERLEAMARKISGRS